MQHFNVREAPNRFWKEVKRIYISQGLSNDFGPRYRNLKRTAVLKTLSEPTEGDFTMQWRFSEDNETTPPTIPTELKCICSNIEPYKVYYLRNILNDNVVQVGSVCRKIIEQHFLDADISDIEDVEDIEDVPLTGNDVYQVECILEDGWQGNTRMFHVKWLGYPLENSTWEPEDNIPKHLIRSYFQGTLRC